MMLVDLATHSQDFSWPQLCQRLFDVRQQWSKVVNVVAWSHHHHDADGKSRKALLMRDALINRQQRVAIFGV